jgi:hypothetical protein
VVSSKNPYGPGVDATQQLVLVSSGTGEHRTVAEPDGIQNQSLTQFPTTAAALPVAVPVFTLAICCFIVAIYRKIR